jgi:ribosomal-protein-alanine N-acetyltransferase
MATDGRGRFAVSAEAEALHPLIRPLTWGDLDRIMEIELAAYPVPWTRGIFSDCIRVGYDCWGLVLGQRLLGYSIQTSAAGEAHLLNLCIEPGWQRRGFGGLLLENAVRLARTRGCSSMFLEVRPSNRAGIALYQDRGFELIGRRPGYYSAPPGQTQNREDALVMQLELTGR